MQNIVCIINLNYMRESEHKRKMALVESIFDLLKMEASRSAVQRQGDQQLLESLQAQSTGGDAGVDKIEAEHDREKNARNERIVILIKELYQLDPESGENIITRILESGETAQGVASYIKKKQSEGYFKK